MMAEMKNSRQSLEFKVEKITLKAEKKEKEIKIRQKQ